MNAFTTRASGAARATISLALSSPRLASSSFGSIWVNGFVASTRIRPPHAGVFRDGAYDTLLLSATLVGSKPIESFEIAHILPIRFPALKDPIGYEAC
ncbi:hypothetical protein HFN06_31905 [Rhizobium leguminosarum]|uniref:hypothetical protein n=1 Tax=Rhizobium leguminosarum TaxID=384 RepID=UPI001CDBEA6A|nr:hypothetical protein [Rhizobium leguminosarum]MCA2436018.1 hypothetical protein [Rhizobium leguminosarum]